MKGAISFLTLLLCSIPAFNQLNKDRVNQYLKTYPKDDIVITEMSNEIEFEYNKKTQNVITYEVIKYKLIALKPYAVAKISTYYDDNTELTNSSISSGRFDKVCGNYTPEGIFHSDLKMCQYTISYTNSGQESTLTIKRRYPDIRYFSKVFFAAQRYPVVKSTVSFKIPEEFDIEIKDFNTENYSFQKNQLPVKSGIIKKDYSCENIPIYHDESEFPPSAYYMPQLAIIPKSYAANKTKLKFFDGLPDFYAWCKNNADKTKNETQKLTPVVHQITEGKKTDTDKIKAIFYWVQDNIRYIAFEEGLAGYIPENAQKVYDDKYGDCKGMANLLKTMLVIAGYDARLTWIGTEDIRFDYTVPTLISSNHVVCALFLNKHRYTLDATNKYNYFGYCSEAIAGRPGLIEDGANYIIDTVPSSNYKENIMLNKLELAINDNNLTGSISLHFDGDFRSSILSSLHYTRTDQKSNILESIVDREYAKVNAINVTTSNIEKRDTTLVINANITIKSLVNQFDNDLYINMDPFDDIYQLDVANNRKLPLFINSREIRKTISRFKIPKGYKLKKLPDNYSLTNGYLSFKTSYSTEGNYLIYSKEIIVHAHLIPQTFMEKWIADLKQIKKSLKQPIVLTKL